MVWGCLRLPPWAVTATLAEDNNQLWIGRGGSVTPCHYDKAENLHMQIQGQKSFLLIPPEQTFVTGLKLPSHGWSWVGMLETLQLGAKDFKISFCLFQVS